jgi:hypothetical protein
LRSVTSEALLLVRTISDRRLGTPDPCGFVGGRCAQIFHFCAQCARHDVILCWTSAVAWGRVICVGGARWAARQPGTRLGRWSIHRYGDRTAGRAPTASPSLASSRRPSGCISRRCTGSLPGASARRLPRTRLYGIAANLVRSLTVCISRAALPTRRQRRALPWEGPPGARPVTRRAGHADQDRSMSRWAGTALSRPLRRVGTTRGHRAKDGSGPSDAIGYRRPDLYGPAIGKRSLPRRQRT